MRAFLHNECNADIEMFYFYRTRTKGEEKVNSFSFVISVNDRRIQQSFLQ
jgi:ketosteroid isomerase-like protein